MQYQDHIIMKIDIYSVKVFYFRTNLIFDHRVVRRWNDIWIILRISELSNHLREYYKIQGWIDLYS